MGAPYTDQELSDFWWGKGGSEESIQPGAYVAMRPQQVINAYNSDPAFAALLRYCFNQSLFGFSRFRNPICQPDGTIKYILGAGPNWLG